MQEPNRASGRYGEEDCIGVISYPGRLVIGAGYSPGNGQDAVGGLGNSTIGGTQREAVLQVFCQDRRMSHPVDSGTGLVEAVISRNGKCCYGGAAITDKCNGRILDNIHRVAGIQCAEIEGGSSAVEFAFTLADNRCGYGKGVGAGSGDSRGGG